MEYILPKNVCDEVLHHYVHVLLGSRCESARFHMQLPFLEVGLLKSLLSVSIELIELVLEELGHDSEARSIEEEIKLLVILLLVCLRQLNFGLLRTSLFLC
jgi:hypothetical protein